MATSLSVLRALEMRKAKTTELAEHLANQISVVAISTASSKKISDGKRILSQDEFKAEAQTYLDKATTLTNTIEELTRAINISNAATSVTIGKKQMTVDQALTFKKIGIVTKRALLRNFMHQASMLSGEFNKRSETFEANLRAKESTITSNADKSDAETTQKLIESIRVCEEPSRPTQVDPLSINKVIAELNEEIRDFETEINYTIVEANAITMITVNI